MHEEGWGVLMIEVLGIHKDTTALHWPGACLPPAAIAMACLLVPPLSSVNGYTSIIHLRLQHMPKHQIQIYISSSISSLKYYK